MRSLIPWGRREEKEWHPFRELEEWHRGIDELFTRAFGKTDGPFGDFAFGNGQPAIETLKKNGSLVVRMDLPGVEPKEVDISITGDLLTVKGERKHKEEKKEGEFTRTEVSYGSFERSVRLPSKIDASAVKATHENGVLEITMPAPKELETKKIAVETAPKK